jgi:alkyl sulfatase BDS1-like metallo-beta-lactamase superfamily hydrolase
MAVIYSHSHEDNFGGIGGVVDPADVESGRVQLLAPVGFMNHAVAKNVYSGNALNRRAFYQYGLLFPRSPFVDVGQSIGKNAALGRVWQIEPNRTIEKDLEEIVIDDVRMVFPNTPGTEAPVELPPNQLILIWS